MTSRTDDRTLGVIDRLNAERKAWSFEIVTHLLLEGEAVVLGRLTIDGATKEAFGAASLARDGRPGSASGALTAAANEALSRAARLFGVGLVPEQQGDAPHAPSAGSGAPTPESRITQKQLGALHGIARRRNLGRTEFSEMLRTRFGRRELISLTKREASDLLTELSESNGHAST